MEEETRQRHSLWGQSLNCPLSHFHYYAKLSAADVLDMSWPLRQSHFWWRWTDNWLNYNRNLRHRDSKCWWFLMFTFCCGALIKISICDVSLLVVCAIASESGRCVAENVALHNSYQLLFTQNNIALDEWVDCVRVFRWDISFFLVLGMNHRSRT